MCCVTVGDPWTARWFEILFGLATLMGNTTLFYGEMYILNRKPDCKEENALSRTRKAELASGDSNAPAMSGLLDKMSRVMRKPTFCICENKDADQLRGNREADQRLCFRYIDSTIPLLSKSEISSL